MKSYFLRSLFFCFSSCRKKSKKERLREKITERFEEKLDIRGFVNMHTNLALILSLMLTKDQMLLYKLNRAHTVSKESLKSSKGKQKDDLDRVINFDSEDLPILTLACLDSSSKSKRALERLSYAV